MTSYLMINVGQIATCTALIILASSYIRCTLTLTVCLSKIYFCFLYMYRIQESKSKHHKLPWAILALWTEQSTKSTLENTTELVFQWLLAIQWIISVLIDNPVHIFTPNINLLTSTQLRLSTEQVYTCLCVYVCVQLCVYKSVCVYVCVYVCVCVGVSNVYVFTLLWCH